MEKWQCIRTCFFRSQLFTPGMITSGVENEIPRHFISTIDEREGQYGKAKNESQDQKVDIESMMKGSPLAEKAKSLSQMNKIELCLYGRTLGLEFISDDMTRHDMIKSIVEAKDKRQETAQEQVNVTKG
jgi:hypothetical protein